MDPHNKCPQCDKVFPEHNFAKHTVNCKLIKLHEEQIRQLKTEHMIEVQELNNKIHELERKLTAGAEPVQQVTEYMNPRIDYVLDISKFTQIFNREYAGLPIGLISELYFEPSHPENMSLHLLNKTTGEMLVMCEDGWKILNIDEVAVKIRELGYALACKGIELYRGSFTGDIKYCCAAVIENTSNPKTIDLDLGIIKKKILESRDKTALSPAISARLESMRKK